MDKAFGLPRMRPISSFRISYALVLIIAGIVSLAVTSCEGQKSPITAEPTPTISSIHDYEPGLVYVHQASPGQRIRFQNYSVDDGLSQNSVHGIIQDQMGFIWIATEDGLDKFDGYEFKTYRNDPEDPNSLSENVTTTLFMDHTGILWIGTYRGGLNRFDPRTEQFTHFVHVPNDPTSLSDKQITAIHVDRTGILWVGTYAGLNRFDPSTETWRVYQADPENLKSISANYVSEIFEDSAGTLWLGTAAGLDRFIRDDESFIHYQHDPNDPLTLNGDLVSAIYEDNSGQLWIGTNNGGLNRFDRISETFISYVHDPNNPRTLAGDYVKAIYEDAWGILWIGTDEGLHWFDQVSGRFIRYHHDPQDPDSLRDNDIICITGDQAGGLWVGTAYGGVSRYDRRSEQFSLFQGDPWSPQSVSANSVWSISEDPSGVLWFGTNGGGLGRYDRARNSWAYYKNMPGISNSLSNDVVMSVHIDSEGVLWLGTWGGGLNRYNPRMRQFTHYQSEPEDPSSISSDVVWLVYEDHEGVLWLGTINGLNRFDRETEEFTHYFYDPDDPKSISDNVIGGAIYEDRLGSLWVGTHGGLNRFDRETESFTRYLHDPDDPQSLSHDVIFSILEDSSGIIWIGTYGGGLNRFDPSTETFTHYRLKDGLPNEAIYGILEDDFGNLWISTNNGLSQFDPDEQNFTNFDEADGLQAREFNYNAYYKNAHGEMFFGGVNGVNAFHPDQIVVSPYIPPVALTSISQGGEPITLESAFEYTTDVTLEWPNNYFDFEFASLDFFQPEQNLYAYKLDGFEEDWNYIGTKRFGRYTNLPGGTYSLLLKGSNNDGVWNEAGASVQITVVPPFWEMWWFRGAFLLIVAAVGISLYSLRVRTLERRSRELAKEVEERTRSLDQRTKELEQRNLETERQKKELSALYHADEQLLSQLELDEVLQTLVNTAVDILRSDKGGLMVWDREKEQLRVTASQGFHQETIRRVSVAAGEGIAGRVAITGEPIIVNDVDADDRVTREIVDVEGIRSFMQVPIKVGDEVFGVFSADYTEPHTFNEREERLLVLLAQRAAIAIENARLYEDARDRLAQITALQETLRAIASTLDLDRLVKLIIEHATTLLQADGGIVNLVNWENNGDEVFAAIGILDYTVGMLSPLEGSLSGWVTLHNQAVISNNLKEDKRVDQDGMPFIVREQMTSAAVAPLTIKNQVIGTLVVVGTETGKKEFVQSELDLLVMFANQAALAIENARLYEQAQQLAVVEERQRLARELHDSVTQAIYGMTLYTEAMARHLTSGDIDMASGQLEELSATAQEALREMRLLIFQLRPPDLEQDGLITVLRTRLEAVEVRAGLETVFNVPTEVRLPLEIEEGLYRIAQEALNNALKHASAQSITVSLIINEPMVTLEISDDGIGFDPVAGLEDAGLGMDGMYERAEQLGGKLIVESTPGTGTTIRVEVPK